MDKDLVHFLLFLEFAFALANTDVLLLPILSANGVSAGLNNDALEGLHPLAHLLVQLLLHRVDVERDVLSETRDESQGLVDCARSRYVGLLHFYEMERTGYTYDEGTY